MMRTIALILIALNTTACSTHNVKVVDWESDEPIAGVVVQEYWHEQLPVGLVQLAMGLPPKGMTRVRDLGLTDSKGHIVIRDLKTDASIRFEKEDYQYQFKHTLDNPLTSDVAVIRLKHTRLGQKPGVTR